MYMWVVTSLEPENDPENEPENANATLPPSAEKDGWLSAPSKLAKVAQYRLNIRVVEQCYDLLDA